MSHPTSRLNIAVLTASASRSAGGLFTSVRRSAMAVRDLGHDIAVLALKDEYSAADLAAWQPLTPQLFSKKGPRAFAYAPGLSAVLAAGSHDIVHLHGLWQYLSVQASRWRRDTGKPVMVSPRGMLDPWALKNSGWKKRIARALFEDDNLRNAACLHALNAAEASAMRAFGLKNPIAVIPNGTDLPDLSLHRSRPTSLPDDGRKSLLFLGRIHPKKGIAELIDAWALLKRRAPQIARHWKLVIAGWDDGGHRPGLERRVTAAGLQESIYFTGPVHGAEKEALLSVTDAFILPSYSEGLPMAVLEAWSYEVPVFMTAACNLPEGFIENAAIEIMTKPEEMVRVLAQYLGDGAENGKALAAFGLRGRSLVAERFTWTRIASQYADVYDWVVNGGPLPGCVVRV